MLKYDQQSTSKSWLKLVICLMIICLCTAGSFYLFCQIHWVAGIVVAVPVWILLVDVLINRRKSMTWYLLDFFRYIIIFAGTAITAWYLWKIDWRIGAISILPVFILLLNIIGFLTLRIYDITPEASASRKAAESLDQFEHEPTKNDSNLQIGVQARIEDAGVLADKGRCEGALLMLLIAVASTSRKRYPQGTPSKKNPNNKMSDSEAFTTFLRDEIWHLVKEHSDFVVYRGKQRPIEDFLYEYLRCQLVHEGRIPIDLYPMRDADVFTIAYPDGSVISFSRVLLTRLNDLVWRAPENSYEATKPEIDEIRKRRSNMSFDSDAK